MKFILLSPDIIAYAIIRTLIILSLIHTFIHIWKWTAITIVVITLPWTPEEPTQERLKAETTSLGPITKMFNDALTKLDAWVETWHIKRKYKRPPWAGRRRFKMVAMTAIMIMEGVSPNTKSETECGPFDSDSTLVGIDNRCSACITHVRSDIPGEVIPCTRVIKGFGGTRTTNIWQGTIHWSWDDDQGQTHKMVIPNGYYVPEGNVRLLSPQHWAQTRKKNSEKRHGAGSETTGNRVRLFWDDRKHSRTVP